MHDYDRRKTAMLEGPDEISGYIADKCEDLRVRLKQCNQVVDLVVEPNAQVIMTEGVDPKSKNGVKNGLTKLHGLLKGMLEDVAFMQGQAKNLK